MRLRASAVGLVLLALSLALLALVSSGCDRDAGGGSGGGGGASSSSSGDILIGHFASMTGDTATFGVSSDEGIQLAKEEINNAGGVLGRKIKVITEDDRSLADEAKTTVQKLINRDHVVALLGEIASSRSIAGAPIAQDERIPMLSPGSTNPKVTEIGDYIFRACFIDPFQGTAVASFALKDLKAKRFAVLYAINSDYSVGLRDYFKNAVKKGGGEIVADLSYTEKSDVDFKGQLTKIRDTNPDAIFVPGYYTEAGLICQQARELGIKVPLMGGYGILDPTYITLAEDGSEGDFATSVGALTEQLPTTKPFIDAYKAAGYADPYEAYGAYAYDAADVIIAALAKVLPGEGRITDELRAKLRQAVQDGTVDGVTGRVAFDHYGDTTARSLTVYKVEKDASGALGWKPEETKEFR